MKQQPPSALDPLERSPSALEHVAPTPPKDVQAQPRARRRRALGLVGPSCPGGRGCLFSVAEIDWQEVQATRHRRGRRQRGTRTSRHSGGCGESPQGRHRRLFHRSRRGDPDLHRDREEPRRRTADERSLQGRRPGSARAICWSKSIRGPIRCSWTQAEGQLAKDQAHARQRAHRSGPLPDAA